MIMALIKLAKLFIKKKENNHQEGFQKEIKLKYVRLN